MTRHRTRRVRPIKRQSSPAAHKKRTVRRTSFNIKGRLTQFLIALVLVIDIVLVVFAVKQCSKPPLEVQEINTPAPETVRIQIEVLNGCGVPGIAAKYTDFLRDNGIDVVKTDNYESFNVLKTVVIDRRGNWKKCKKIAHAMGLSEDRILQEINDAYLLDASLIIGKDFRQLSSWNQVEKYIEQR
ncbi:LytR C-terminal domain-containing protein [bacterium]|nr:LytR C-terminal domain-containing protein [bacterium]